MSGTPTVTFDQQQLQESCGGANTSPMHFRQLTRFSFRRRKKLEDQINQIRLDDVKMLR